ncbi:MAG TPA: hypothetical protein DCQ78_01520 [Ruminococcus sp.]|nr:hypothetical protein [Ruminococcus sp.]
MADKKSFLIYLDNQKQVNMLTDEQAGKLFKALFAFAKDGIEPDFDDGVVAMIFSFMSDSIKRDTEKYEEVCENRRKAGKLGGRPKKANGFFENQTKAKKADIDNDKDIDNDIDNDMDKDMEKDKEKESPLTSTTLQTQQILNLYNQICVSLPKIRKLSTSCQKDVEKIISTYSEDEIKEAFEKAEKSVFLKGKKNSDKFKTWKADFVWIVKEEHFMNLFNGKYDNTEDDERLLDYESFMNNF